MGAAPPALPPRQVIREVLWPCRWEVHTAAQQGVVLPSRQPLRYGRLGADGFS